MDSENQTLKFQYVNWEGKEGIREIIPKEIWYGATKWHPEEQWFLKAIDVEKNAERDFALKDIVKFL